METLIQILAVLVLVGVVGVGVVALADRLLGRVTVHEYERGIRMEGGKIVGLVGPGRFTFPSFSTEVLVVDTRPVSHIVEGQEVPTSDGVPVKVSLVVRSAVGDPIARLQADQDADRLVYQLAQLGLREVVAQRTFDELLADRTTVGPALRDIVAGRLGEIGVEILSIDIRDVMLPAELKRAQAAVVAARYEGAAKLERARGETAALRNLANGAAVLDDHPGLRSLRLVQELAQGVGHTVVLGVPDAASGEGAMARSSGARGRRATDPPPGLTD
jgi:regulator of protease activity HflC (stomatin/prohibitin superfamily)